MSPQGPCSSIPGQIGLVSCSYTLPCFTDLFSVVILCIFISCPVSLINSLPCLGYFLPCYTYILCPVFGMSCGNTLLCYCGGQGHNEGSDIRSMTVSTNSTDELQNHTKCEQSGHMQTVTLCVRTCMCVVWWW